MSSDFSVHHSTFSRCDSPKSAVICNTTGTQQATRIIKVRQVQFCIEMTHEQIKELNLKRDGVKGSIKRFQTYLDMHTDADKVDFFTNFKISYTEIPRTKIGFIKNITQNFLL